MMKKLFLVVLLAWASLGQAQDVTYDGRYFIELHNGERVYARQLRFKSPIFKQNFFLLDDSLRFAPEMVKYYQNQDGFFARLDAGRRYSDFAQREQAGRVSTYFVYRASGGGFSPGVGIGMGGVGVGMGGYGYGMPSQRRVYYFAKEKEPLQPLTYKNLRVALSDNPGSVESLQEYKRGQNIQTGIYVAGGAVLVAGLSQQLRSGPSNSSFSPMLLVGAGIMLIPQIINLVKKDRLAEAIEMYNYTPRQ